MSGMRIEAIRGQDASTQSALIELNNAHARETSFLTPEKWQTLVSGAFCANCIIGPVGLLIAFDQDADYDSPNFAWFRERWPRFVYIDRIIVSQDHRGKGLARLLYRDLFQRARVAGHDQVACEVNLIPPNPGSTAFHSQMGFTELGRANLVHGDKTVQYLAKRLGGIADDL